MKKIVTTVGSLGILALALLAYHTQASAQTRSAVPTAQSQTKPGAAAPGAAAPQTSGQALEIAPPVITLSANPGETIKTEINLRNISNTNLLVKSQINDFVAAGEDGTPKLILEETEEENPHSMKKWVTPFANQVIVPRQIKKLPLTITIPASASPGGYYGVVRFTAAPPELKDTGVSLSASLGSLVLLTVKGKVAEKVSLAEFKVGKDGKDGTLFQSTPLNFKLRMKNEGNIHEQPVGSATITDMFGKKVALVNFNQPPRNILPGSIRKFEAPLDSATIGSKKLFGKYTADLRMEYGVDKQLVTSQLTFWVIPYTLVGIIIAVLIGGFFALRFFIIRYNRSIIKKAQQLQGVEPPKKPARKPAKTPKPPKGSGK